MPAELGGDPGKQMSIVPPEEYVTDSGSGRCCPQLVERNAQREGLHTLFKLRFFFPPVHIVENSLIKYIF